MFKLKLKLRLLHVIVTKVAVIVYVIACPLLHLWFLEYATIITVIVSGSSVCRVLTERKKSMLSFRIDFIFS